MEKKTSQLLSELSEVADIKDYFASNDAELRIPELTAALNELIAREKISRSKLAARANLDRYYVYEIFSGRKVPGTDKLLCIALALKLDQEETERLLRLAGRPGLYARRARDSILIFALQRHLPVDETDELLYEAGEPLLTD